MIQVDNLTYEYSDKRALENVSFTIGPGAITALVGPNGSGKTTLLRSLAALAKPTSGSIIVNGYDAFTDPREVHLQTGYLQDLFGLYDDLTVQQSMEFTAHSRLNPDSDIDAAIALAISRSGISSFTYRKVGTLSRGMRQRVGIAQAIVHQPKVLLLDEPASGLDPEARHALSGLLIDLQKSGMTIIVSSHILAELEDYSTEMLIIREGKMIEHRNLNATSLTNSRISLQIKMVSDAAPFTEFISTIRGVSEVATENSLLTINLDPMILTKSDLLIKLIEARIPVEEFHEKKINLQDEYIKTVSNLHNKS